VRSAAPVAQRTSVRHVDNRSDVLGDKHAFLLQLFKIHCKDALCSRFQALQVFFGGLLLVSFVLLAPNSFRLVD